MLRKGRRRIRMAERKVSRKEEGEIELETGTMGSRKNGKHPSSLHPKPGRRRLLENEPKAPEKVPPRAGPAPYSIRASAGRSLA